MKHSYGNRVIVCQTTFLLWVSPFLSYELWKQRIELWKLAIQTTLNTPTMDKDNQENSYTQHLHGTVHEMLVWGLHVTSMQATRRKIPRL